MRWFLPVSVVLLGALAPTVAATPLGEGPPDLEVEPCAVAPAACDAVSDAYRAVLAMLDAEPQDGLVGILEALLGVDPCEETLAAVCGPPGGG